MSKKELPYARKLFGLPNTPIENAIITVVYTSYHEYKRSINLPGGPKRVIEGSRWIARCNSDIKGVKALNFHMFAGEDTEPQIQFDKLIEQEDGNVAQGIDKGALKYNEYVYTKTMQSLRLGKIPAIVGGAPSVSYSGIEAVSKKYPIFDVLHIDAEARMFEPNSEGTWTSRSLMYNVASRIPNVNNIVQVSAQNLFEEEFDYINVLNNAASKERPSVSHGSILDSLGKMYVKIWTHTQQDLSVEKFQGKTWLRVCEHIMTPLREHVWVNIDIRCLKGEGAFNPSGLEYDELLFLLKKVAKSGRKIVGFNIVGVNGKVETGMKAADLLYKLSGYAAASQNILEWRSNE